MRAKRVSCRLCKSRGSIRNKMAITKAGKTFYICLSDAKRITATYLELQHPGHVPPRDGRDARPLDGFWIKTQPPVPGSEDTCSIF